MVYNYVSQYSERNRVHAWQEIKTQTPTVVLFSTTICDMYGGWFGTLLCVLLAQATTRQSVKRRVVRLSSCCPVANDARQTARCRAAYCRDVTLSLGLNRRIGLQAKRQGDIATARRTTTRRLALATGRQCAWCFVVLSLATRRKGDNDIGAVVANDNATRSVPN
jgi:hypothetical protein